jgi:hypothetical protein
MRFYIMDQTGHSTVEFKKDDVDTAMKKFMELTQTEKKIAAVRTGEGQMRKTSAFDPSADEMVFFSPMRGG